MTDADNKLYDKAEELFCQNCKLRAEQCLFAYRKVNGIEDCHKSCGCEKVPAWIDGYQKGIEEMKKEACEFAILKTTIAKLRDNYEQYKAVVEPEIERLEKENAELRIKVTTLENANRVWLKNLMIL